MWASDYWDGGYWSSSYWDEGAAVVPPAPPAPPAPPTPPAPPGGGGGNIVSAHDLLTPQVILVPRGSQWSKEEAERWAHRARKTPAEKDRERDERADAEEQEAIVLVLSLLL